MKNKLIKIIKEIIELLHSCGYSNKADWFNKRLSTIEREDINSENFKSQIREIGSMIAGMGSFTDLSLMPNPNSGITEEQASQRQWELADELDKVIGQLLSDVK